MLAAAIVRHDTANESSAQTVWELDLTSGEDKEFATLEPTAQPFAATEVLIRLFSPDQRGCRVLYLASPPDARPAQRWEVGVRPEQDPAEEGELVVDESPGVAGCLRGRR